MGRATFRRGKSTIFKFSPQPSKAGGRLLFAYATIGRTRRCGQSISTCTFEPITKMSSWFSRALRQFGVTALIQKRGVRGGLLRAGQAPSLPSIGNVHYNASSRPVRPRSLLMRAIEESVQTEPETGLCSLDSILVRVAEKLGCARKGQRGTLVLVRLSELDVVRVVAGEAAMFHVLHAAHRGILDFFPGSLVANVGNGYLAFVLPSTAGEVVTSIRRLTSAISKGVPFGRHLICCRTNASVCVLDGMCGDARLHFDRAMELLKAVTSGEGAVQSEEVTRSGRRSAPVPECVVI